MKTLFILLILLISFNSFSQVARPVITHTERGMKMIGGQLQLAYVDLFSSETILRVDDYGSEAGILISPNIGWFIEKNWLMGGMLHLGFYSNREGKNTPANNRKENAFDAGITPFTRYYIDLIRRSNVKIFLQAGLPIIYSAHNSKYTYTSGTNTFTSTSESRDLGLYGNWGGGASFHGRFGAIEMNLSSLGLNIGFQKFIGKRGQP